MYFDFTGLPDVSLVSGLKVFRTVNQQSSKALATLIS